MLLQKIKKNILEVARSHIEEVNIASNPNVPVSDVMLLWFHGSAYVQAVM